MKWYVMDIPDDPAELPGWLERHLTGLDLAALVAELEAVHGLPSGEMPPLSDLLGERLEAVLSVGLGILPAETLRQFLRRPKLLLELQELVLASGGDYWDRVGSPSAELGDRLERGIERLRLPPAAEVKTEPAREPEKPAIAWYRRPVIVSLTAAASVLVAFFIGQRSRPTTVSTVVVTPSAWGWARPGAMSEGLPAAAYLDRLADAAAEWSRERPDLPAPLARRIAQFRQGCSELILAEHQPLAAEDRRWLVVRCRTWAGALDRHLAAVEAGQDPVRVRAEVDELVAALIEALRARAEAVRAGRGARVG
jgi:hypothetical protein